MAWVDVSRAHDSVDHCWLLKVLEVHRFPQTISYTIGSLTSSWNTRIVAEAKQGYEQSGVIRFNKSLPQGDALCPRLFTLCLNPVAWKLSVTEGYRLSKPLDLKITYLLYIDDLKIFAASENKLKTVLKVIKAAMQNIGVNWNAKKCTEVELDEEEVIKHLEDGTRYKFLGVLEDIPLDDKMFLGCAAKVYLKRLSVIWSSPLSDENRLIASNQFALQILSYLMWTQRWPLTELRSIDREVRKIIVRMVANILSDQRLCHIYHETKAEEGCSQLRACTRQRRSRQQNWNSCPPHVVAEMHELYVQLLPTRLLCKENWNHSCPRCAVQMGKLLRVFLISLLVLSVWPNKVPLAT